MSDGLNIRIGGQYLDVPRGARLKYRLTNNIFFDGEKQRERSLPLRLDATLHNDAVLGHLRDAKREVAAQTLWDCELYSGRLFVAEGRLKVRQTGADYEAHVVGRWSVMQDIIGDANMRDISWMTGSPGTWTKQDLAEGSYPAYPVWYPAMMMPKAAYQDVWDAEAGSDNLVFGITGRYIIGTMPDSNNRAANAAFYVLYILDRICGHYGLGQLQGEFRTDSELSKLLLHSLDIRNGDWNRAQFTAESVPDMKVLDFLGVIETLFCCQLELDNDLRLTARFLRDTAARTDYLDWTDRLSGTMRRKWEGNTQGLELRWPDNLTDMYRPYEPPQRQAALKFDNNADMMLDTATLSGDNDGRALYVRCDNGWFSPRVVNASRKWLLEDWNLQIQQADELIVLPEVADYGSLPAASSGNAGAVCLVRSEGWYYQSTGVRWDKAFWNSASIRLGQRQRAIEPKGAPVPMDKLGPDYGGQLGGGSRFEMRVPGFKGVRCRHDATEESGAEAPTDLMPMFSFKREIWTVSRTDWPGPPNNPGPPISTQFTYGYASSDEFDPAGAEAYHYSLWWDGPNGLHEVWWKGWGRFLSTAQEAEADLNLRLTDLLALDLHRPLLLDGVKCWIKELEIELPLRGPVRARLMRDGAV